MYLMGWKSPHPNINLRKKLEYMRQGLFPYFFDDVNTWNFLAKWYLTSQGPYSSFALDLDVLLSLFLSS